MPETQPHAELSPLRVLLVEDRAADALLLVQALRRAGFVFGWQRVDTQAEYLAQLDRPLELILADYAMPEFDGLQALRLLRQRGLNVPFIMVTGADGEDFAVTAMHEGADDYLLKDRLARLGQAVTRAFEQRRLREDKWRADQALRDSERRFRALIEQSADTVVVLAADGTLCYASPSLPRILGYQLRDLAGRSAFEVVHPDDLEPVRLVLAELLQTPGSHRRTEFRCRHKDGRWRWLEATATNLLHEPCVQGIVCNGRDVTERKQAEQAARDAIQARDEFLSVAAHELKTPVASLYAYAQVLLRELATGTRLDEARLRRALTTIEQQAAKLGRLVGLLLEVSRIESGHLDLRTQPVDLVPLVRGSVEATRARTCGHTLHSTTPAAAWIVADALRIEQVLANLLDNAIKYSPDGGDVFVELEPTRAGCVQFSVRDHGLGIPAEKRGHLFDRFYRAHAADYVSGLGLGLAISRQIVEQHGGQIMAEFPPDGGTRIVVRLPERVPPLDSKQDLEAVR
jgi:PAS domain S-box-containing protein